jgi:hypothetical protein
MFAMPVPNVIRSVVASNSARWTKASLPPMTSLLQMVS